MYFPFRCYPGATPRLSDLMTSKPISKRVVDGLKVEPNEYSIWDPQLRGFGVRVRPTGAMSYVVLYRSGSGRGAQQRRFTIGTVGKITPAQARARAKAILAAVTQGNDPAADKADERESLTVSELADRFLTGKPRLKYRTVEFYRDIIDRLLRPAFGASKANKLSRETVVRFHQRLASTPFQANRMLAAVSSIYSFGEDAALVPAGTNPAPNIDRYKEESRERYLTSEELVRLGGAIRDAETVGLPWRVEETRSSHKHLPKANNRLTRLDAHAAAALRLLLFTGCRLREILDLRWEDVDFERGLLFLPTSKTSRKTIVLNAPALEVLGKLERRGSYVVAGSDTEKPRADLKRPWRMIANHAGLTSVRLHDLRHTYASVGAGGGLGLPIIGKLLGHKHSSTTSRYAHLDNDPLRRATESIGGKIAAAMGDISAKGGEVISLKQSAG
jgi:integrase